MPLPPGWRASTSRSSSRTATAAAQGRGWLRADERCRPAARGPPHPGCRRPARRVPGAGQAAGAGAVVPDVRPRWSGSGPLTSWGSRRATPEIRRRRLARHRLGAECRTGSTGRRRGSGHGRSSRHRARREDPLRLRATGHRADLRRRRRAVPQLDDADRPQYLPAVVGRQFLDLSGASVGEEVAASISGLRVTLAIIGVTDQFPSLDRRTVRDRRRNDAGAVAPGHDRPGRRDEGMVAQRRSSGRSRRGRTAQRPDRRDRGHRASSADPLAGERPGLAGDHRRARPGGAGRARLRVDRLRRQRDGHVKRAGHGVRDPAGAGAVGAGAVGMGLARERVPAGLRAPRGLVPRRRPVVARAAVRHAHRDRRGGRPGTRHRRAVGRDGTALRRRGRPVRGHRCDRHAAGPAGRYQHRPAIGGG